MQKVKLVIVEDNRLLRDGLAASLGARGPFEIVGAFGGSDHVATKSSCLMADVLLVNAGLTTPTSRAFAAHMKEHGEPAKTVITDVLHGTHSVVDFIEAGVSGFIMKDATIADWIETIRAVAEGRNVVPDPLMPALFSEIATRAPFVRERAIADSIHMTRREREIVTLISHGMNNKEIASHLNIATYTVKTHVHNVLEKLRLRSRVQLAAWYSRNPPVKSPLPPRIWERAVGDERRTIGQA